MLNKRIVSIITLLFLMVSFYCPIQVGATNVVLNMGITEIQGIFNQISNKLKGMKDLEKIAVFGAMEAYLSSDERIDELAREIENENTDLFGLIPFLEQSGIDKDAAAGAFRLFKIWDTNIRMDYIEKLRDERNISPIDQELALYRKINGKFSQIEDEMNQVNLDLGTFLIAVFAIQKANDGQPIFADGEEQYEDIGIQDISDSIKNKMDNLLQGYIINDVEYSNFDTMMTTFISKVNEILSEDEKTELKTILKEYELYVEGEKPEPDPKPNPSPKPNPRPGGGGTGSTTPVNPPADTEPKTEPEPEHQEDEQNSQQVPKETISFTDMDSALWAKPYVEALVEKNIISGVGEGKFAPNRNITREEFTKMIVEAFDLLDETAQTELEDVAVDAWYYKYVASAEKKDIVNGIGNNKFGIGTNITRQDMATIAYRGAKSANVEIKETKEVDNFIDAEQISDYAHESITLMQQADIINGMSDGRFAPKENATRAQAAKIIYFLYNAYNVQ